MGKACFPFQCLLGCFLIAAVLLQTPQAYSGELRQGMLLALTASDINDHQGNERVYTPVYGSGAGITVGWKWLESVAEMHLLPYNNRMNYDLSVCTNAGPKIFFFRPYVGAGYLYQRTSLKEMEKIQTDHDLRLNLGIITNEIVALEWVAMMGGNPAWRFRLAFLFPV